MDEKRLLKFDDARVNQLWRRLDQIIAEFLELGIWKLPLEKAAAAQAFLAEGQTELRWTLQGRGMMVELVRGYKAEFLFGVTRPAAPEPAPVAKMSVN